MDGTQGPNHRGQFTSYDSNHASRKSTGRHRTKGSVQQADSPKKLERIEEEEYDSAYGSDPESPVHRAKVKPASEEPSMQHHRESWRRINGYIQSKAVPAQYPDALAHEAEEHLRNNNITATVHKLRQIPLEERFSMIKRIAYPEFKRDYRLTPQVSQKLDELLVEAFVDQFISEHATELPPLYYGFKSDSGQLFSFLKKQNLTQRNTHPHLYMNITDQLMITLRYLVDGPSIPKGRQ